MSKVVRHAARAALSVAACMAALPLSAQQAQFTAPPVPGPYPLSVVPVPMAPQTGGALATGFVAPPGSMRVPYWLQQPPSASAPAENAAAAEPAARGAAPAQQGTVSYGQMPVPGFRPGGQQAVPGGPAAMQGWPYPQQGYAPQGYGYAAQGYPPQGYMPQGYPLPAWGAQPGWGAPAWQQQNQGRKQ